MQKFYRFVWGVAPFLLLWTWQVWLVPDMGLGAYIVLQVLFIGYGILAYTRGVRDAIHIGMRHMQTFINDITKEKP
jgi:hypothetical protein